MNDLLVMIEIAGRRCAINANDVSSVIELRKVAPVPRTPDFIMGITALRSQALTVIDCRSALGIDPGEFPTDERAAVISIDNHPYALVVDRIEDITTAQSEPAEVTGGFGEEWGRVTTGMVETSMGPALLVDLAALIAGPETIPDAA